MLRVLIILLFLSSSIYSQVSIGLHGAGSWSQMQEIAGEDVSDLYDDYKDVYGFGGDIMLRPIGSPLGIEVGFTYLNKANDVLGIETRGNMHPIYLSGVLFISPMLYLAGGVNYTLWDLEIDDVSLDNLDGKLGYQGGIGIELGTGNLRLYAAGYYMIQKGEIGNAGEVLNIPVIDIELQETIEFEARNFMVRAGIRFGI